MKITIKTSGVYNDAKNKSRYCNSGEELETKEWYGKSLITAGLATAAVKAEPKNEVKNVEVAIPIEDAPAVEVAPVIPPAEEAPEYPMDSKVEILEVEKTLAGKKAKA